MRSLLAFAVVMVCGAACMPPPDYTTTSGVDVYDSEHRSSAEEVQAWLEIIIEKAPEDEARVRTFKEVYDGTTITITSEEEVSATCVRRHSAACAVGATKNILVPWLECPLYLNTASALGHEVGHLMGYHHDEGGKGGPWFDSETKAGVQFYVYKDVCGL